MADIRASVKGGDQRRRSRVLVALLLVASLAVVGVAGWYVGLWPGHRFAVADLLGDEGTASAIPRCRHTCHSTTLIHQSLKYS